VGAVTIVIEHTLVGTASRKWQTADNVAPLRTSAGAAAAGAVGSSEQTRVPCCVRCFWEA
jgi:hypothetical protein